MIDSGTNIVPIVSGVKSSITEWFSRPQLIQTLPWIEGGTINTFISPLAQFFDPALTSNWDKLKGYSKLRGNLHLKIELNASPFHYGALNVSWAPLTTEQGNSTAGKINYDCLNSFSGASISSYGDFAKGTTSALMRATQRLNGFLYPQDCNTLDFNIPFLYPKEFIELRSFPYTDNSFANNSLELYQFGSLMFNTAVPLQVAQALTGGIVTINIFAWMTEVELEGPSLVLTSGVASAAGEAMASFKSVPIIGGYLAKAGAISKASAKVMSLLGMSNFPDEKAATACQVTIMPAFSSPEIDTNSRYIGLASHSGLTMAPTESWSDEMQIDQFGKSSTYLGTAEWSIANPKGTSIFQANVTPENYLLESVSGSGGGITHAVTSTPSCYISSMFGQWRGKVKYHFTAVASQFHRGRLRFYYDSSVSVPFKEGFIFSKVWDITETKNFEFEVPFTASTQMLQLAHPQYSCTELTTYNFRVAGATNSLRPINPNFHNGQVKMEVLNQLLGPNAASVRILCFTSIEDLEFADPCAPGTFVATGNLRPGVASLNYLTLSHDFVTTSADVPSDHKPFDPEIYNGEKITSLRTLLHRSSEYTALAAPPTNLAATGGGVLAGRLTFPREPLSPGEHSYGTSASRVSDNTAVKFANNLELSNIVVGGQNIGYNYVAMSPYVFLKAMFAGYRGSFRWKFFSDLPPFKTDAPGNGISDFPNNPLTVSLTVTRSSDYTSDAMWAPRSASATYSQSAFDSIAKPPNRGRGMIRGAELNSIMFGSAVSVDVPQYSRFKFLPTNDCVRSFVRNTAPSARLGAIAGTDGIYDVATDSIDLDYSFTNPQSWFAGTDRSIRAPVISANVSCGTDFSFVGFINTPIVFVKTTPPAPRG